jgi:hypothetical protein
MCSACQKNSKGPALRTKFRLSIIERSLITLHRSVDLLYVVSWPIQVAARSEAWVCGSSLAGIVGSNPTASMDLSCECCMLSGRDLCVGLILPTVVCLSVIMYPR